MSVEDIALEVRRRITFLKTPAAEFLNVDIKENKQLLSNLEFLLRIDLNNPLFIGLAKECKPLIEEFRKQNIHLFDKVVSFHSSDMILKLREVEGKQFDYTYTGFTKSGNITLVDDDLKLKWYKLYRKEIDQYDEIFTKLLGSNAVMKAKKSNKKKSTGFIISADQASQLLVLNIIDGDEKNGSLFNTLQSSDAIALHNVMRKPDNITEMSPNPAFTFDCENYYAIFVFKWFQEKKMITHVATFIHNAAIFYPKSRKMVLNLDRIGTDWGVLKSKCPDWKEIINEKITKSSSKINLDDSSRPCEIIRYLHLELSRIFPAKGKLM